MKSTKQTKEKLLLNQALGLLLALYEIEDSKELKFAFEDIERFLIKAGAIKSKEVI